MKRWKFELWKGASAYCGKAGTYEGYGGSGMRQFAFRTILTITTRRLLTKPNGERGNGIRDVYEILSYMTGDNVFTHQIPRTMKECQPILKSYIPESVVSEDEIKNLDTYVNSEEDKNYYTAIDKWLDEVSAVRNLTKETLLHVPTLEEGKHKVIDPMEELRGMLGGGESRIIGVVIPEEDKGYE